MRWPMQPWPWQRQSDGDGGGSGDDGNHGWILGDGDSDGESGCDADVNGVRDSDGDGNGDGMNLYPSQCLARLVLLEPPDSLPPLSVEKHRRVSRHLRLPGTHPWAPPWCCKMPLAQNPTIRPSAPNSGLPMSLPCSACGCRSWFCPWPPPSPTLRRRARARPSARTLPRPRRGST